MRAHVEENRPFSARIQGMQGLEEHIAKLMKAIMVSLMSRSMVLLPILALPRRKESEDAKVFGKRNRSVENRK